MYSTRALYTAFLAVIIVFIGLFAGSLVFFHQASHRAYQYDVRQDNRLIGAIKIDRFTTDDRTVFKQTAETPTDPVYITDKTRLALDKKGVFESFTDERFTREGTASLFCVESRDARLSFLSRFLSAIVYVDNIPARKDIFLFRADMPVTYLPIIERYDFRRGRSQSFPALVYESHLLPPAKRQVTLTSIRDEYLKIEGKKIKTENLILKIRGYPQGSIWVAKSDRKLIMIELPERGLRIIRAFGRQKTAPPAGEPASAAQPDEAPYTEKEVVIKSGNTLLAGTLTCPSADGRYPSVLLVQGKGPYNREYMGFFTALADYLGRAGFAVLRYDTRGTGKSSGDPNWPRTAETVDDLSAALRFLAEQPEIDPGRIAVVAHADGALAAARAAQTEKAAAAIVFISPDVYSITDYAQDTALLDATACRRGWDRAYRDLILMASGDTRDRVEKAKLGWEYILGKRCFLGEIKEQLKADPFESYGKLAIPALIVQGQEDRECAGDSASSLKQALESQGKASVNLVYYDGLNRFLGAPINNGASRRNYAPSADVMKTLRSWLERTLPAVPSQ